MIPETTFPEEKDYFNAFIRTAQYITHLTPRQDILAETGNALVSFYGAGLVGFFEMQRGELTSHHWILPGGLSPEDVLTDTMRKSVREVFSSGFLESLHITMPERYAVAFLPITWETQTTAVMLVGHRTSLPVPEDLLNTYLAVAGLVSTAISTSVAAFENIAEKKRAEEALRQSEERYRTLFSTMIEGFCIIEVVFDSSGRPSDYRFLEVNPAFEQQTGLHDAKGRLMRDLVPDHEDHWFELYGKIALTGEPARFVNEARALSRWYDVSAVRVGGAKSRKVAILFNDITERIRYEEELKRRHDDLNNAYGELTATQEELRQTNDELLRNEQALMSRNEDLLAMNEELRAAQDELTRNEQALVSRNEELNTLNEELTATQEELEQNVSALIRREMELRASEEDLKKAVVEKEVLLSEVHHRVKNNLAAFISLLALDGTFEESAPGQRLKKDLQNRARSMALIHETLYRTGRFSNVDMDFYLTTLIGQIAGSYADSAGIRTAVAAKGIDLDLARATTAGLIINELVTNSFKYAFPPEFDCTAVRGEPCTISVSLTPDNGSYTLIVADNGRGLPAGLNPLTSKSLGLKLVNFLARHQLRATVNVRADKGAMFVFHLDKTDTIS
jgi:PAS domain S-box-containing protein